MQRRGDGWIATGWLALLALLFAGWLAVAPLPAQFGDLVGDFLELDGNMLWNGVDYDAPGTGEAVRMSRVLQPGGWGNVGLADAASDFLTADQSTMSDTPVTFLSASVTVPEQGDTVIVSVSGLWEWMGAGFYVADDANPDSVWTCTPARVWVCSEDLLPSGIRSAQGITQFGGMLYVADGTSPDSVWTCTLALVCSEEDLPSGFSSVKGITAFGGMLYVLDGTNPSSVWTCTLALVCSEEDLPSEAGGNTQGITASGGMLYVLDNASPDSVWTCTLALVCSEDLLPSGFSAGAAGITEDGEMLYVLETHPGIDSVWTCTLALVCSEDLLPSGFGDPSGITATADAPCEWRIARDATELESIDLNEGAPAMLLDGLTVIDRPAAGTYVYSAQMSTSTPETVCTAYQGGGITPLPSLLVQVFYGE